MNKTLLLVLLVLAVGLFPKTTKTVLNTAVDVTHNAFAVATGAVAHAANQ